MADNALGERRLWAWERPGPAGSCSAGSGAAVGDGVGLEERPGSGRRAVASGSADCGGHTRLHRPRIGRIRNHRALDGRTRMYQPRNGRRRMADYLGSSGRSARRWRAA
uniref:Uncharacterized protein n=3 Tax=Oryza TaxID=4527 RepID=A0A0D3GHM1_9ORYZ